MVSSSFFKTQIRLGLFTLCFSAMSLFAGDTLESFVVGLDIDNNPETGCELVLGNGSVIEGVEKVLTVEVDMQVVPPMVQSSSVRDCGGEDVAFDGGGWPVGLNNGSSGGDVVESWLPLELLGDAETIRLVFEAKSASGSVDVIESTLGNPILIGQAIAIPTLSQWGFAFFILLLLAAALIIMRKRRMLTRAALTLALFSSFLILFAAVGGSFVLDGEITDWAGVAPAATDPGNDSEPSSERIDLLAVYACVDDEGNLFFRFDVNDAQNDAPIANDDSAVAAPESAVNIPVTGNDSDPDSGDILTVVAVTAPANGSAVIQGDNSIEYTSNPGFLGTDTFTYTLSDSFGETDTALVSVEVSSQNQAPTPLDDSATVQLSGTVTVLDSGSSTLLTNDTDPNGDNLSVTITPISGPEFGVLTLNNDGTFIYTHDGTLKVGDPLGSDSFVYEVCDDANPSLCAEAAVNITIVTTNNPPVAVDDSGVVDEDGEVIVDVLDNDSDPDGDALNLVTVIPEPGHSVVVNSDQTISFAPAANFNGTAGFTYSVRDVDGLIDTAAVQITVNPVNDGPVSSADVGVTGEDTAIDLDVLANDGDVDGDTLAVDSFTQGSSGSVSQNPDGTLAYTPNPGFGGQDSFVYVATDGALDGASTQVLVTVTADTDTPVINDDEAGTDEDTPVSIDVLLNDEEFGEGPLVIVSVSQGANGTVTFNEDGTITYFPNPGFVGEDTFTYSVVDAEGNLYVGTVTVFVAEVNTAPTANDDLLAVAQNEEVVGALMSNDFDPDPSDTLTIVNVFGAVHGEVSITDGGQTATFDPNPGFIGVASFSYSIEDQDGLGDTALVSINVQRPNEIGVAIDDLAATLEDRAVDIDVTANDRGTERAINQILSPPANGQALITEDNTIIYTPNADFSGADSFDYQLGGPLFGPQESDLGDSFTATVTVTVTPLADPPSVGDDNAVTDEDIAVTINVLANDSDPEGSDLTLTLVAPPLNGVTQIVNQQILYTPDPNWFGVDLFVYTVADETGLTRSGNVSVTVNSVNDDPSADPQNLTTDEETPLAITLTGSDVDEDSLTFSITQDPSDGTLTNPAGAVVTYTPNVAFNGTDSFEFQVDDGNGGTDTAVVSIEVGGVNDPPSPEDQSVTVEEDGSLVISLAATDKDGDTLTFGIETDPENGSLSAVTQNPPNGASVTYTPESDFDGSDSFSFSVSDGGKLAPIGTVLITVDAVNDAPELDLDGATPGDGYSGVFTEGAGPVAAVNSAGLTVVDVDSDNLVSATATLAATPDGADETLAVNTAGTGITAVYAGGTLTMTGDVSVALWQQVLRTMTYDNGSASPDESARLITVTVNDGVTVRSSLAPSNSAVSTITVGSVNNDPTASDDGPYTVAEGDTLTVAAGTGVLANDNDAEGAPLTATLDTNVVNGVLTLNPDGSFTYVHDGGETTSDSFTYHANDGVNDSNIATVSLTVTAVNDAPVANPDSSYKVIEGQTLEIAATEGVLANDTDAEDDTLTAVLDTTTSNGVLTLNPDGSFTYAHDGGETTSDSFTYHANDGAVDSNIVTVALTVTATNDTPVSVADGPYNVGEGDTLDVSAAAGVLANDTDADDDPLTAVLDTTTTNGALTLNADGSFTYVHNGSDTTSDSFTYHAFDGNAAADPVTAEIVISATNDPPVAVADGPYDVDEGATLNVNAVAGVLANDTDSEGSDLTAVLDADVGNGTLTLNPDGSFTYVHDGSETTSDSFTYHANDGSLDSTPVLVSLNISAVNDAPVAVADGPYSVDEGDTLTVIAAAGVLANDTDPESDTLTAVLQTDVANGTLTLNADGSFTYVQDGSEVTSDSFTYVANDGNDDSNIVTVAITVNPVNDAPTAVADSHTVDEGGTLNINAAAGVLSNDTDAENDTLTAALDTNVSNGVLTLNGDGSFTYVHDGTETNSDSFTYHANDGNEDSNIVTVSLAITPVNDSPTAVADAYTVAEGATLTIAAGAGVLNNDSDPESSPLTAVLDSNVSNGALTLNGDGSFTYVHDGSETVADSFTYHANDGTADSNTVTVAITVTPVNDAPVAVADGPYNLAEGGTLNINAAAGVLANDTDEETDALTAVLDITTANGSLTLNPDGSFDYTHNGGETTSDSFTYHANDGADSNIATVTITVTPVNDPPVITAQSAIVIDEDTSATLDLSMFNVTDPDNTYPTDFTLDIDTGPDYTLVGTTVTPAPNFSGFLSVQLRVNDGAADSNTWLGNIVVNPINDGPVIDLDGDGAGTGFAATFTEDGGAVAVVDTDLTLTDDDSVNLEGARATLNTIPDGVAESLAVNTAGTAIVANYDDTTGVLTLTGTDTLVNYRDVLATMTYDNSDQDPDATQRDVSVVANDGTEDGTTAVSVITIVPVNDEPVAVADGPLALDEGDTLTVNTFAKMGLGVLGNDSDPEDDTLTAVLDTDVSNGTLTLNPNGTFSYTHDGSETVADSFTYHANDGALDSNTVTVSFTINPINDLPVADATADSVNEGAAVTITLTGSDAEGSALTFSVVGAPANGSLGGITQLTPTSASVTYTHDGSETTSDSFTFNVNDGTTDGATAALVSLTINPVNDLPVADAAADIVDEGDAVTVTLTGSDGEGSPLTFSVITGPTNGSLGGITQLTPTSASVTYTHDGSETVGDSFTFRVNDGTADSAADATATITVTPVNDLPIADAGADAVDEGDPVTITLTGSDAEGSALTFSVVGTPANGSLGGITQLTPTSASVTYTHDGSETTSDSFTFRVNDGTADSAANATVSITVNPVNDLPTVDDNADTLDEGTATTITLTGGDGDGDALTFTTVTGPTNGSLGAITQLTPTSASVTYTHDGSETVADSFTFRANDGIANSATNATVTLTITPQNDTPVADAGADAVDEGDPVTITLTGSDAEGSALTFAVATGPSNGSLGGITQLTPTSASVTYTHDGGETITDSFTFTVNDGTVDSSAATVSITVNPVNDLPTVNDGAETLNEGAALALTLIGADVDGDNLTFSTVTGPTNGSLGAITQLTPTTASVTYTHDGSETTNDSFTFRVNDGSVNSATNATFSLTITPQNDAPVANAVADAVDEGDPVTITLTGSDAEGSALTFAVASGPTNGSLGGITQLTPTSASVTYTHNGGETNSDSFTFTVNDGTVDSAAATASITVNPVNDLPVANAAADSVNEGAGVVITLSGSDAEGSALTFSTVGGPTNGSLSGYTQLTPTTASVTYTHDGSETVNDSFTFQVNDGTANSAAATVSITVNPQNDTPVANATVGAVDQGLGVAITVSGSDAEGSALTFATASGPTNGSLSGYTQLTPTTASVTYTHDNSLTTNDSFTFTVNDGSATSAAATVTITITLANLPPTATDDTFKMVSNGRLEVSVADTGVPAVVVTGSVRDNDTDPESATNTLTITGTSNVTAGASVTMNADGTFHYTPPVGRTADDTFDYTVSDGIASDTGTVTIQFFNQVWFVDNEAAAGGLGRASDPFDTLAEAEAAADGTDIIYVDNGDGSTTGHGGGITLANNRVLIGSGVALQVDVDGSTETLEAAGTAPNITNSGGDVVALGDGNTIRGINIAASNGSGIRGSSDGGTTSIDTVTITTSGASNAVELTGQTGTFSFDGTITGSSTGDGLAIGTSTAAFTFNNLNVSGQSDGILLSANTAGSFNFTGTTTIGTNTSSGINITGDNTGTTDSSVTFANLAATSTSGVGLSVTNFDGSSTFTAGTITHSGGRVVALSNADSGMDLSGLTIAGSSHGVSATGSAGTFSFPDFTVAAATTVDAVSLTSNTGATFNFDTITATGLSSVSGLVATGGGTVNITDTNSALSGTGDSILVLNGIAIGGSNMTFASLSASNTGNNEGIDIDSVTGGTLNVSGTTTVNTTTGSFPGIDINGSSATFTFGTVDIDSTSGQGVSLVSNTGPVTVSAGNVTGSTLAAVDIDQGNGSVTFNGSINNSSGRAVEVTNRTGGTVSFGGAITDSTGSNTGLLIQNNSSGSPVINFTALVTLNTGTNTPATIATNTGATVGFSNIDFDTTTGTGFAASSTGTVNVTAGTVNTTNGEAVNISNCGQGITFTSVTGANSSGNGINLSTNTGTITFNGLDITNTGGTGILASNAGTLAIAGSTNDIATTTGLAVNIANTTIGGDGSSGGINLRAVSASSATNGILLNTTGSGRFVVTGTGSTAGSGGTIQNITNNGIELRSCNNVSLSNMNLTNANTTDNCGTEAYDETGSENCRGAIYMNTVAHMTYDNVAINTTAENGITGVDVTHFRLLNSSITNAGNSTSESGINLRDLLGTAGDGNTNVIQSTTIDNSAQIGVFIRNLKRTNNHAGEADRIEFTNSSVINSGDNSVGDNITISLRDDASSNGSNVQTVVSGCTLTGVTGEITDAIQFDSGINAKGDFQISTTSTNNCNTGINISASNNSTTTFLVNNNTNINADAGNGVNVACNGSADMSGTISNNTIDSFNANNPGFGIDGTVDSDGTLVLDVDNNTVTDFSIPIRAGARGGSGTANLSITDNTMSSGGGFAFGVLWVFSGNNTGGETSSTCANISGNNFNDPFGTQEYYIEQYPNCTMNLQGYGGSATSESAIQTFLEGNNVAGDALVETCCGTSANVGNATCTTPAFAPDRGR